MIFVNIDNKVAILRYNNQLTEWFDEIYEETLLSKSNYFVAKKNGKFAIYKYKRITPASL